MNWLGLGLPVEAEDRCARVNFTKTIPKSKKKKKKCYFCFQFIVTIFFLSLQLPSSVNSSQE
jgi:hypothetical protein